MGMRKVAKPECDAVQRGVGDRKNVLRGILFKGTENLSCLGVKLQLLVAVAGKITSVGGAGGVGDAAGIVLVVK